MIKHFKGKTIAPLAIGLGITLAAGPAFAFDCARVSSSPTGLANSAKSGKWEYINTEAFVADLVESGFWTEAQGDCVAEAYLATGLATDFAIGIGVAKGQDFVIAEHNPNKQGVLGDGKGIDHLEEAIFPAIIGAIAGCGAPNPFE